MDRASPPGQTELANLLERISGTFKVSFEPLAMDEGNFEVLNIENMPEHLAKLLQGRKIQNPLQDLPLWAKVWPASFVLGRFLRKFEPTGKTLLELGAGMGICSLIAARHGFSRIYATDVNGDALTFAKANILHNNLQDIVKTRQLDITSPGVDDRFADGVDFIAASEILYIDALHRPLLKFVSRHLKKGGKAFFCTDLARAKPHFQKLASRDFKIAEGKIGVKSKEEDGAESRRLYSILILDRQ